MLNITNVVSVKVIKKVFYIFMCRKRRRVRHLIRSLLLLLLSLEYNFNYILLRFLEINP